MWPFLWRVFVPLEYEGDKRKKEKLKERKKNWKKERRKEKEKRWKDKVSKMQHAFLLPEVTMNHYFFLTGK